MKMAVFELLDNWEREVARCRDKRSGAGGGGSRARARQAKLKEKGVKGGKALLKRIAKAAAKGQKLTGKLADANKALPVKLRYKVRKVRKK